MPKSLFSAVLMAGSFFLLNTPVHGQSASLTVVYPNGGENWQQGSTYTVQWTSSGNVGSQVKVEVRKGGNLIDTYGESTPNDGSMNLTVPTSYGTGSNYRVRVVSITNSSIADSSDADFSISTGSEEGGFFYRLISVLLSLPATLFDLFSSLPIAPGPIGPPGFVLELLIDLFHPFFCSLGAPSPFGLPCEPGPAV
ncbi:MAG: hypothetical protein HYV26_08465 [Candidatus Hydrogenedentes bacterium]|nr:hypothetical protein [Candidatus Hydrogenedentota bacterium]